MNVSPNEPFSIPVSNFADREAQLPKHINIAQKAEPASIIHAIDTDDLEARLVETSDASTNLKFNAPDDKVNTQASPQIDVSVVHYKLQNPEIPKIHDTLP